MTPTANSDDTASNSLDDVYHGVLSALDATALITVNESCSEPSPGELRVEYVEDSPVKVNLRGFNGARYQIQIPNDGPPVLYELTEDGLSYVTEVLTIELIGRVDS